MSNPTITKLKSLIETKLDLNLRAENISEDASLFEGGLEFDSMALVDFISVIEEEFGIQYSDEDLSPENFRTLTVVANQITKLKAADEIKAV